MKAITTNLIKVNKVYNDIKLTCNHYSLDVSKYGILTCLNCNEIVVYNGKNLESEKQKAIRIDLSNNIHR